MREEHYGKFIFKVNLIGTLPKPIELSHKWILKNFNYKEPLFYTILFNDSEAGPFEVPPGHTKVYLIRKPAPGAPNLFFFRKARVFVCSVHFSYNFF